MSILIYNVFFPASCLLFFLFWPLPPCAQFDNWQFWSRISRLFRSSTFISGNRNENNAQRGKRNEAKRYTV